MGVLLKKRGAKYLPNWYGELIVDGKRTIVNLAVRWRGKPVDSLLKTGDTAFERSREQAMTKLEGLKIHYREKGRAEHLTARLIESKTGQKVEYVKLVDLAAKWRGLGRTSQPSEKHLHWCDSVFGKFVAAVPAKYLHEVSHEQAADYLQGLKGKYTLKTIRDVGQLLRSAFSRLLPVGVVNPFDGFLNRKSKDEEGDTVHRRPLTVEELGRLLEVARGDEFLYPLVVTSACTGMRIGDVCRMKWKSVDLDAGVVAVRTSKTGAVVEIPIFPPLRAVLQAARSMGRKGAEYVFPEAEEMIENNPNGITWRGKVLFARAFADTVPKKTGKKLSKTEPDVKLSDVLETVSGAVAAHLGGVKRDRILDTLQRYAGGASYRDIEAQTGRHRGQTSADLHEAQEIAGVRFLPERPDGKHTLKGLIQKVTRIERGEPKKLADGKAEKMRDASTLGWHSLRVTWVTLALSAGVPMEVARLVTGHKTVEVVLKHYFKPGREHLRAVLGDKLPDVLTGGKEEPKRLPVGGVAVEESAVGGDAVKELAAKVAAGSATDEERRRLCELLAVPARGGRRAGPKK